MEKTYQNKLQKMLTNIAQSESYGEFSNDEQNLIGVIRQLDDAYEINKKLRNSISYLLENFMSFMQSWDKDKIEKYLLETNFDDKNFKLESLDEYNNFVDSWNGKLGSDQTQELLFEMLNANILGSFKEWKKATIDAKERAEMEEKVKKQREEYAKEIEKNAKKYKEEQKANKLIEKLQTKNLKH